MSCERQYTEQFTAQYARRAGIEGTISQGTHHGDLRRTRYIGFVKTRLMHLLLGAALNYMRVAAWVGGEAARTHPTVGLCRTCRGTRQAATR